jgi:hypothetical protein
VKVKNVKFDALVVGAIRPPTGHRLLSGLVVGWPREDGLLDYAGAVEVGFAPGEHKAADLAIMRQPTYSKTTEANGLVDERR